MANRDLSLSKRAENVREKRKIPFPVHFSAEEIKDHFVDVMSNIKKQFKVAQSLLENGKEEECKMIWRSQIVLAEGLLDFYLHEVSKYCMFNMFCNNWFKSEKYKSFQVPMSKVEEAMTTSHTNEWFFDYLNKRFSRDVFLSAESMKEQMNLIGLKFTTVMEKAFPRDKQETSVKEGRKIIQDLFDRRNKVAHQYDRSHETAQQEDISKEYVEKYIDNIEKLINAIHDVILEKDT
ncbi:MAG: hypothetical protein LIO65_06870, partial [Odoribacter sp.]|nr:hypothetical protein [Odoribacter sp.]